MINNRFNVVYHLLCVGVDIKVKCLIGELKKILKEKEEWGVLILNIYI